MSYKLQSMSVSIVKRDDHFIKPLYRSNTDYVLMHEAIHTIGKGIFCNKEKKMLLLLHDQCLIYFWCLGEGKNVNMGIKALFVLCVCSEKYENECRVLN